MKFKEYLDATPLLPMQRRVIEGETMFEYRGYTARLVQNDDERFWIEYDPILPNNIATNIKLRNPQEFRVTATKAIDLAHAAQVSASGNAASAGAVGAGPGSGPLRRANG